MCRGGTEPRSAAEWTTLETAELAHREYVVDRLSAEFPGQWWNAMFRVVLRCLDIA